jgi:hypothetical protein
MGTPRSSSSNTALALIGWIRRYRLCTLYRVRVLERTRKCGKNVLKMRMLALASVGASALALCAGCSQPKVPPTLVTEVGCVTASGHEFILTDLEPAGLAKTRPSTDAYLLQGADPELEAAAGRRVQVSGSVDPAEVTDIRILQPLALESKKKSPSEVPAVEVGQQIRLATRTLQVLAVDPLGERCQLAGPVG